MTYEISYTDGTTAERFDTLDAAEEHCDGNAWHWGHDNDLSEGGERTLVWETAGDAAGDDGSNAIASIREA